MIAIITSAISCVRYLQFIQLSNFYFYPYSWKITSSLKTRIDTTVISYIISSLTIL